MRLFEHPDFEQAMVRAAVRFDVNEQCVEKDYYVTRTIDIGEVEQFGETEGD